MKTNIEEKEKKEKKEKQNKETISITINKKKLINTLLIIVSIAAVLGLSFYASNSYSYTTYEYTNVTVDEYLELMKSEDKKIIYIAKPTCSYCVMQNPILKKIAQKYNLVVHYLNTENFVDQSTQDYTEDGNKFVGSSEVFQERWGTPNTIIVQNGKVVDGLYQYSEQNELMDLFERNGFINE